MINKIKVKIKEARPPLFLFFLSIFLFGGFFIPLQFASATTTITSNITADTTWNTADDVYIIQNSISINSGVTLTIDPGVIVKFKSNISLTVNGTLDAQGTSGNLIYFTAYTDDDVGGDTNEDGPSSGTAGYWRHISVSSTGGATISHAVVRFGGNTGSSDDSSVYVDGGVLILATSTVSDSGKYGIRQDSGTTTVTNCILSDNSYHGLRLFGGNATIASSTIENNAAYGLYGSGSGDLTVIDTDFSNNSTAAYLSLSSGLLFTHSGNTASGANAKNGFFITGNVTKDTTWTADTKMPYIISTVTVNVGKTLTINPGAVIKFETTTSRLVVNGTLDVQGSSEDKVYFTSLDDDDIGGDTGGDATSTPEAGDWRDIEIGATGSSTISHAIVRYGGRGYGGSYSYANIYNNGGVLNVFDSEIASSSVYGIRNHTGTTTIVNSEIYKNSYGVAYYWGIGGSRITNTNIHDNSSYGVYNFTTPTLNAENNYWGGATTTGPYHADYNPGGAGDAISGGIDFIPWADANHFLLGLTAVDEGEIRWGGSTQYIDAWGWATSTWNALGEIDILPDIPSTYEDLTIDDVWDDEIELVAWYDHDWWGADELKMNEYEMDQINSDEKRNAVTHELGHALGLDHSYLYTVMYQYVSEQTTLTGQDIVDYEYLWVD